MTSNWIEHVKAYQKEHGVDYKTAMKEAKSSYQKTGGAIKPKRIMRKARNTVNKLSNEMDQHQDLINLVDKKGHSKKVRKAIDKTQDVMDIFDGGKFNAKRAIRKGKNTVKKAKKISKSASKYYEMAKPGLEMIPVVGDVIDYADGINSGVKIANELTGGKVKSNKSNKYIKAVSGGSFRTNSGGSFRTASGIGNNRPAIGSSLLSPMHPSFAPQLNTLSNRLKTNNI